MAVQANKITQFQLNKMSILDRESNKKGHSLISDGSTLLFNIFTYHLPKSLTYESNSRC